MIFLLLPTFADAVLQGTILQPGIAIPFRRIWTAAILLLPLMMPIFGGGAEIDGSNIQFNPETLDAVQRRPYDRALQAFGDGSRTWTYASIEQEYNLQPKTFRLYKNWSDQQPVVTAEELHRIARGLLFSFNINARLSSCNYSNGSLGRKKTC